MTTAEVPARPGGPAGLAGSAPITAVLITKNAAEHLDAVLRSVACCAEILVLDSGSSDDTEAIARRHGARFEYQDWLGFGAQKRECIRRASHDWVFSIDGDEILDEEAQAALAGFDTAAADPSTAWAVHRRNLVGSTEIRHGDWAPDWTIRLFNRRHNNIEDVPIHEAVRPVARLQRLSGSMIHYSYKDLADVFRLDYHRAKGERYRARGRRASGPALFIRALGAFLRSYLVRGGWRDGTAGVIVALSVALNASLGLALASEPR